MLITLAGGLLLLRALQCIWARSPSYDYRSNLSVYLVYGDISAYMPICSVIHVFWYCSGSWLAVGWDLVYIPVLLQGPLPREVGHVKLGVAYGWRC